jgi:hypothetical protein
MRVVLAWTIALAAMSGVASAGSVGLDGLWAGEMRQIEATEEVRYPMTLTIAGKSATADYPTLNCIGTWTRIASKNGYTIYAETVTNRKGASCIDGMVMVTMDKGRVVLGWFASYDGAPSVATAVLSKAAK